MSAAIHLLTVAARCIQAIDVQVEQPGGARDVLRGCRHKGEGQPQHESHGLWRIGEVHTVSSKIFASRAIKLCPCATCTTVNGGPRFRAPTRLAPHIAAFLFARVLNRKMTNIPPRTAPRRISRGGMVWLGWLALWLTGAGWALGLLA